MTATTSWGPGPWILLFPLLWITLIATVAWLLRRRGWGPPHRGLSGRQTLDRLFAEGQITPEEYRSRRRVLDERT
jgi:putative membrane protein